LKSFTEKGFHATSVDDIATHAQISRATLYQYFASKDEIFVELMHDCGASLLRVTRTLGDLGPTAAGFGHLVAWVGESSAVFDRYPDMYIEWANVNSPEAPLRPKLALFVDAFAERFNQALVTAGYSHADASVASVLTLSVWTRFNYIRHVYRPGLTDNEMSDTMATALQLYLFPDTPAAVLAGGLDVMHDKQAERPDMPHIGPLATLPPRDSVAKFSPLDGLRPQAAGTVRTLLDAAARVFAAQGFNAANVDQIVTEAGVARGTFYRYFTTKNELIAALASEASARMCPLFAEFETFATDRDEGRLHSWLTRFLFVQRQYAGVMRAWTEGLPIDPVLLAPAADVVRSLSHAVAACFGPTRPYPLHRRAAGILLAGLLEHFPNEGAGSKHEPTDEQVVAAQAQFLDRVLFPKETRRAPSRSAMLVAACRMLASELPDHERLINDPFAARVVDELAITQARADEQLQNVIRLRTRYIDDVVQAFVEANKSRRPQVLLLGAGLDARPFRMQVDAHYFEIDLPATLDLRGRLLADAVALSPRTMVPVDFASGHFVEPLLAAGFDRTAPTIVVWEGVINYLDTATAESVVRQIADVLSPASQLVADYVELAWFKGGTFEHSTEVVSKQLRDGGEPLRAGLPDVLGTLQRSGFHVLDDEAVELLRTRYGLEERPRFYPSRIFTAIVGPQE
jgi:methyltransferase (TIGR00027 family)